MYLLNGKYFDINAAYKSILLNGIEVSTPSGFFMEQTNRDQLGKALTEVADPDTAINAVAIDPVTLAVTVTPYTQVELDKMAADKADSITLQLENAVQSWMDGRVWKERQYDSILNLSKYINSSNKRWATEAASGLEWNTAVLDYLLKVQADVLSGNRPIPTEDELIADVEASVPLVWGT